MLTDDLISAAEPRERPYKLSDSGGLFVYVTPKGSKSLRLKYRIAGREKQLVFGLHPFISLTEARRLSLEAKEMLRARRDPSGAGAWPPAIPNLKDIALPEDGPRTLYFIQAASGHVKIGVASDAASRISAIQAHHPEPLRILGQMPGGYAHELYVHRLFHEDRRNGEWFKPSRRLLDFIEDNATRP